MKQDISKNAQAINPRYDLKLYLPTSVKEMKLLGWDHVDVVIFSGDAYVDHPSFGAAVIGRTLQAAGYNVAIVPQPNWTDDLRDFKKFGAPRLFFGISPGAMDSMVNHYTAARRRRSDDAYTPGGRHGARPDYPSIVYTEILRKLYPDTPILLGGIEGSLRRLSHYDYWEDRLRPSILHDAPADLLVYGMGGKTGARNSAPSRRGREHPRNGFHTADRIAHRRIGGTRSIGRRQYRATFIRRMSGAEEETGRKLQAYRAGKQPDGAKSGALAEKWRKGREGESDASANDHRRD